MNGYIFRQGRMMPRIDFYNYYHNGDLFCTRAYVKQIIDELASFEFRYFHNNNPKTTSDLINYGGSASTYPHNERFVETEDSLAINTWIAIYYADRYPKPPYFNNGGINYVILHSIWKHIFEKINTKFNTNLVLRPSPEDYIATIDFTKFDLSNVHRFIEERPNKKRILFSNGVPMSGQSFSYNFSEHINVLAETHSNYDFICTNRFTHDKSNIFFTSDITKVSSDLNEIGYLSRFCDVIIGKNSGPFIYCLEKENFTNPKKKIISFNNLKEDSLDYGIDIECDYTCSQSNDANEILQTIKRKIESL